MQPDPEGPHALRPPAAANHVAPGPGMSFRGSAAEMPPPRPVGVIARPPGGGRRPGPQRLRSRIRVRGGAPAVLELRFGGAGRDALGFAVRVPHSLAGAVYP